jgi:nitroimidazol reductase NimA-like FMN-containing flavoprotein (pyridoxamine 5'-phosphate oxidase superfamily)
MKASFRDMIIRLLDQHRIMTVATNRSDGWPQATTVSYANDGLVLYSFIARSGQKYGNIRRDPRVSVAIAKDYPQPLAIKGLSFAGRALVIEDRGEVDHAYGLLLRRYPEYKVKPRPIPTAVPLIRITPEVISILDYSKGFGHSDLVRVVESDLEQFIESRRHHWAWHPVD